MDTNKQMNGTSQLEETETNFVSRVWRPIGQSAIHLYTEIEVRKERTSDQALWTSFVVEKSMAEDQV